MITVSSVRKCFNGSAVLDNVSFTVPKGGVTFLLGKSGSGKSVLLKCMVGLVKPDSGAVWVDTAQVTTLNEVQLQKLRKNFTLVFQSPALLDSLNVFENVAFGLRSHKLCNTESEIEERVLEAMRSVDLDSKTFDRQVRQLSFGTQKRVSIARALVLRPNYLLYDEPATGLDPKAMYSINRLIRELSVNLKLTSVVVSHEMDCALEIADQILCIEKGKIIAEGTASQILSSNHPIVRSFIDTSGVNL